MDQIRQVWIEDRMKRTVEKLKAHGFEAISVSRSGDAVMEILRHVGPDTKVGVGGSVTVRELGIPERLEGKAKIVYDLWKPGLPKEKIPEFRKRHMESDLFLSSVNAVTLNGELVNIDGVGNRTNSMTFGPGKVILVIGYNKIANDIQEAIQRTKNVAAPMNARRLNADVPCAKLGKCIDCDSPHRICRVMVIHERKPSLTDVLVILVGEELGY